MSVDKKDQGAKGGEQTQLMLIALLLLCAWLSKIWPGLIAFWLRHRISIFLLLGLIIFSALAAVIMKVWNRYVQKCQDQGITEAEETAVFLGEDTESWRSAYLRQEFRTMHAQIIGTTNAGKTESAVIPMVVQDFKNGSGVLLIDGKSDASLINKLYPYIRQYKREKDFKMFSLPHIGPSSTFNPLRGDTAQEVTERVFSSFLFENEYYKNVQYKIFLSLIRLIFAQKQVPTFSLVHQLLINMEELGKWVQACPDENLKREMTRYMSLSDKDREEKVSGLDAILSDFTASEVSCLFEETDNRIDFDDAMEKGQIIYFQLPTMYYPRLAAATGKLVLQCFQNAVSKRQIKMGGGAHESEVLFLHPR